MGYKWVFRHFRAYVRTGGLAVIFLRLRRVRMYAAFFPKRCYMKNSDWQSLYFGHEIKLSEIRKLFA